MKKNLYRTLEARFPADPDAPWVVMPDGARITYADVGTITGRLANRLARLGVGTGDRVAVQVEKSALNALLYLAVIRAGAVFLPLNTAYTPQEVAYFLGDAEAALLVCDPAKCDVLKPVAETTGVPRIETLDANGAGTLTEGLDGESPDFETVARDGDDLAAMLYTSGTTGRSKGAMITHANLAWNAQALSTTWAFEQNDRLLHALPIFHVHGLFTAINTVMWAGASMIFLPGFNADAVLDELPHATVMMGVPTFYTRLLAHSGFTREATQHMRLFISGSAPLSAEIHKEFFDRTGLAILERYGMTETGMNTSNPYEGERRPGTIGFPLPGLDIRIANPETGTPVPDGEVGVIEIRGDNVFKGYWRNDAKTREAFRDDGFFVSGDLARKDADGYISIVGRDKDLIITGGYNVYPAEVEAVLDALPGVAESAVIGVPHPDFGEGVTAVVAPRDDAALDPDRLLADISGELAKFKLPKAVFIVEALPRNTMGKIQKNVLRDTYAETFRKA